MAQLETLEKEIGIIRKDIEQIKIKLSENMLFAEDFELSDHAKKLLKEARETPEEEYVDL